MDTKLRSICAYDPGETTGVAKLTIFNKWHFYELKEDEMLKSLREGSYYAICETSVGKDGITSAYIRGIIRGLREYYDWFEQAPAERRKFLPIAHDIVKSKMKHASDHMMDACAHVLCFLYNNDKDRYDEVMKEVRGWKR